MALVFADRVQETTTTSGTGSVTLAGAATGYQTFNAGIGVGNTCYYCIASQTFGTWEVGLGTLSAATTLARTTPLNGSSGASTLVSFGAETKNVFVTNPATNVLNPQTDSFTAGISDPTGNTGSAAINIVAPINSANANFIWVANGTGTGTTFRINPGNGLGGGASVAGSIDNCNIGLVTSAPGQFTALTSILSASFQSGFSSLAASSVTGGLSTDTLATSSTSTFTGQATFSGGALFAAGTTTVAPIKLTAGTNLTTAAAGSIEYDGSLEYFTPVGAARALTPSVYYYRKNTATTLASVATAQSIFGLTTGVTLAANTIYEVEGFFP
jgi:hypothetical protein